MGTFFATSALAAAWAVWGNVPLRARIGQSLALCAYAVLPVLSLGLISISAGDELILLALVYGFLAIGLSILIAVPLWLLFKSRGIRLRHSTELACEIRGAYLQYGIRELLIVTGGTAVLLGSLRWLLQWFQDMPAVEAGRGLLIACYLAICGAVAMLPLLVGVLLRRFAVVSVLIGLIFVAFVTACELAVLKRFDRFPSSDFSLLLLAAMNYTAAAWILSVIGTLRAGGYRLAAAKEAQVNAGDSDAGSVGN